MVACVRGNTMAAKQLIRPKRKQRTHGLVGFRAHMRRTMGLVYIYNTYILNEWLFKLS